MVDPSLECSGQNITPDKTGNAGLAEFQLKRRVFSPRCSGRKGRFGDLNLFFFPR